MAERPTSGPGRRSPGDDREVVGGLLRRLRRAAGFRSVEAAATTPGCPVSRQTIYTYERGELLPPLSQLLELVEFYVLRDDRPGRGTDEELRILGVATVVRALYLPAYHVVRAWELINRLQAGGRG
ncbi:MAG: hypothetical protein KatS3mg013_0942 [Actinomycetota bacterium]|jgi:DNA-binding XRE family transcriptional regulator|nr:MAG: hypothetical protein KatS3mg013_0942 [Actinomycetota bacterium]